MHVGILQFELIVRHSRSLKDKRRVVKSVKDRLHRHHLVSVAEVAAHDHHRLAVLGLAAVGATAGRVNTVLDRVHERLSGLADAELGAVARDVLSGADVAGGGPADGDPLWTEAERRERSS